MMKNHMATGALIAMISVLMSAGVQAQNFPAPTIPCDAAHENTTTFFRVGGQGYIYYCSGGEWYLQDILRCYINGYCVYL